MVIDKMLKDIEKLQSTVEYLDYRIEKLEKKKDGKEDK